MPAKFSCRRLRRPDNIRQLYNFFISRESASKGLHKELRKHEKFMYNSIQNDLTSVGTIVLTFNLILSPPD
jgi:hypothetical protein